MTAKPAPVIVDGVPMCTVECPLAGTRFYCPLTNARISAALPCIPAIREMHAELVQLRKRDPLAKCGMCDRRDNAVRRVPRGIGWHDEANARVCRGCYDAERNDGEPQWEDLEP